VGHAPVAFRSIFVRRDIDEYYTSSSLRKGEIPECGAARVERSTCWGAQFIISSWMPSAPAAGYRVNSATGNTGGGQGGGQIGGYYSSQGLIGATPRASKSLVLRVTTVRPRSRAVAAIMPSGALRDRPASCR
jgi:hypothetical protein